MMKNYHSRQELEIDVQFIKAMIKDDYAYRHQMIKEAFDHWKKTSPDSPWYEVEEVEVEVEVEEEVEEVEVVEEDTYVLECANTLIKISQGNGVSSEWCGEHIVFETVRSKGGSPGNNRYNLRPR
tara:strand:- start:875 stop:1249 length:375 start_codon:yes stop_codon:yes gene_type:complete